MMLPLPDDMFSLIIYKIFQTNMVNNLLVFLSKTPCVLIYMHTQ